MAVMDLADEAERVLAYLNLLPRIPEVNQRLGTDTSPFFSAYLI
jgi:hypothetical protein